MLLFGQTFYPVIGAGREDDSSVVTSHAVVSETEAHSTDEREHVEQKRHVVSAPPWTNNRKPLNNRKGSRSALAPTGNSPLLSGCWDYSEVD